VFRDLFIVRRVHCGHFHGLHGMIWGLLHCVVGGSGGRDSNFFPRKVRSTKNSLPSEARISKIFGKNLHRDPPRRRRVFIYFGLHGLDWGCSSFPLGAIQSFRGARPLGRGMRAPRV